MLKLCGLEVVWMAVFLCHSLTLDLKEVKNSVFKSLRPWISVHSSKLSVSRGSPVLLNRDISTHACVYITVIFQYKNSIITSNFNDTVSPDSLQGGMMGTLGNLEPNTGFKSHSSLSPVRVSHFILIIFFITWVVCCELADETIQYTSSYKQGLYLGPFFKVKKLLHHIFARIFTNHRHYHQTVNTQLLQQFYLPL